MSRKGIPNFEATAEERKQVELFVACALSHEQCALLIRRPDADGEMRPISVDTLTRHFADELACGKARMQVKIAGNVLQVAAGLRRTGDAPASVRDELVAAFFILKTQHGFRETLGLELPQTGEADADDNETAAAIAGLLEKGRRQALKRAKPDRSKMN